MWNIQKPILVTGIHRSGTTWTGKIISASSKVNYVHEPFNIDYAGAKSPLDYWFEYYSSETDKKKEKAILKHINSLYRPPFKKLAWNILKEGKNGRLKPVLIETKHYLTDRPLVKDPIAILSAPWLYQKLKCDVVVCIRHPAAFIASIKEKNWQFDFNQLLNQKRLMHDHLTDFRKEIENFAQIPPDIISQGILLWNIVYSMVAEYQRIFLNKWCFIKHEDLSRNPMEFFKKIYDFLELPFEEKVENKILATSKASKVGQLHRNSKENILLWKKRLSEKEIENIRKGTYNVWTHYYKDSDW